MIKLYAKLLLVQKELQAIPKEESNPFFKSKYFDINALIEHVKPILNKHNLILIQPLVNLDGKVALSTELMDADSGDCLKAVVPLPDQSDPQKMGSAITYFRRYAVQSLLFLQAEDDDGNIASNPTKTAVATKGNVINGYEYSTGVSTKTDPNGKRWYRKCKVGTKDATWLKEEEYNSALAGAATLDPLNF